MKKHFVKIIAPICVLLCTSGVYAADTYRFDPDHTYVTWEVTHFGYSQVSGKLIGAGTIMLDSAKPENSSVTVTFQTAAITTGIPKLDDTLKGKNFFDVSEFPTATFQSTRIFIASKSTGNVFGTLTVRGVTKNIVLNMKLNLHAKHPFYGKDAYGFSGSATVKRSDFGMRGYIPAVSDDVKLEIQAEAMLDGAGVAP